MAKCNQLTALPFKGLNTFHIVSCKRLDIGLPAWPSGKFNKSDQSKLGRGPRRGAVAHVRRKVPIDYNGAPKIRPQKCSSRGPIPKPHYLPIPGPVRLMMPNGIRIRSAVLPQCTGQTDAPTDRHTDRQIVHRKIRRL